VFEQDVLMPSALLRGMGPRFPVPVSRHAESDRDCLAQSGVAVLAGSTQTGASIVEDRENSAVFVFDHLEYAGDTLLLEYERDRQKGLSVAPPRQSSPGEAWQPFAALFFRNWLDAAAASRTAAEEGEPLTWLFEERCGSDQGGAEILLQAATHPHLLSEVLTQLAAVGVDPTFAHVRSAAHGRSHVGVRHDAQSPVSMDRIADALLAVAGIRRVLIRMADGSGGFYCSRGRPDFARAA
jgi:hypothetical protein